MGGLLPLIEDGDPIVIDVERRTVTLDLTDEAIDARRATARPPVPADERGWLSIYARTVAPMQTGAVLVKP